MPHPTSMWSAVPRRSRPARGGRRAVRACSAAALAGALGAVLVLGTGSASAAPVVQRSTAQGSTAQGSTVQGPTAQRSGGHRPGRAPDLGPNVEVFDPSMPTAQIKAAADAIAAKQVNDEMGTGRYALLFKPGVYGSAADPLDIQVGYYTEVAGLGKEPGDVVVNGHIEVFNRCLAPDNCIALNNFWRSMSNLTINITARDGCRAGRDFWAVSQAAPLRRVDVTGGQLSLMDYCTAGPQYASGGFISDSRFGTVINGSQQQFLVRDSTMTSWSNGVWNQVFAGVQGAPAQSFPNPTYTTVDSNPLSRERPYLYVDVRGRWQVFVPSARKDSSGTTWAGGATAGRSVPLDDFVLVRPGTRLSEVQSALGRGRNVLFLPGVYDVDRSLLVTRPDTLVLGLGLPSLTANRGAVPVQVADVPGVVVAGLMIDAGTQTSPALLRVGLRPGRGGGHDAHHGGRAPDPTTIQDVFFRVGGPHAGKATVALEVNSDDVLLDDIWAWRADHGEGVGWTVNPAENGVVVRGDDVVATGLFSEHFRRDNVVWSGERGRTIFFQNELPYDPPSQAAWTQSDGTLGYAGYRVADSVRTHELWGGGSYIFTNVDPNIHASQGFRVPNRPGVRLHDVLTVSLNGAGTIDHIVNGAGEAATPDTPGNAKFLVSYP